MADGIGELLVDSLQNVWWVHESKETVVVNPTLTSFRGSVRANAGRGFEHVVFGNTW